MQFSLTWARIFFIILPYQPDGSFEIENVYSGKAKAAVTTEHPLRWQRKDVPKEQRPPMPSDDVVRKWFPINSRYNSFDTSPLETDVQQGENCSLFLKIPYKESE